MNTIHEKAPQAENPTLFQPDNSLLSRTDLVIFGITALMIALSFLFDNPNMSQAEFQKTAFIEDWHGNVARSR